MNTVKKLLTGINSLFVNLLNLFMILKNKKGLKLLKLNVALSIKGIKMLNMF